MLALAAPKSARSTVFWPQRKVWDPKVMPMGIVDGQEVCGWCLQFIDRTVNPNTLQRPGDLARVSGEDRGCIRSKRERERWFVSSRYREASQPGGVFRRSDRNCGATCTSSKNTETEKKRLHPLEAKTRHGPPPRGRGLSKGARPTRAGVADDRSAQGSGLRARQTKVK